jgi:hypothetical protein
MTIETKYNIGDEVWFMWRNTIASGNVQFGLCTLNRDSSVTITYDVATNLISIPLTCRESEIFPTKEELLKSL